MQRHEQTVSATEEGTKAGKGTGPPWFLPVAVIATGSLVLILQMTGLRVALRDFADSQGLWPALGDLLFTAIGGVGFAAVCWFLTLKNRWHRWQALQPGIARRGRWVLAGSLLFACAYPASQGPAAYAMNRGWLHPTLFVAVYRPLWSKLIPEPIDHLRSSYVQWWVERARPPAVPPLLPAAPAPQPSDAAGAAVTPP